MLSVTCFSLQSHDGSLVRSLDSDPITLSPSAFHHFSSSSHTQKNILLLPSRMSLKWDVLCSVFPPVCKLIPQNQCKAQTSYNIVLVKCLLKGSSKHKNTQVNSDDVNWKVHTVATVEPQQTTQFQSVWNRPEHVETVQKATSLRCVPLRSSLFENLLNIVMKGLHQPSPFHHSWEVHCMTVYVVTISPSVVCLSEVIQPEC